jgi:hypothetical protein
MLSSLVLAAFFLVYVPIGADGGWYSYPAYAWSQGGDPSENIPGTAWPSPLPERPVAKFGWENRSNLTVLLTKDWFDLYSPSWLSLKIFGALQVLLIAALAALAVQMITSDRIAAFFAACLVLSDSRILAAGLSDARPDLFIAAFALGLLATLWAAFERRNTGALIGAIALALLLPMLHVTAANAISFLLVLLGLLALAHRHDRDAARWMGLTMLFAALLLGAFFGKQPLLDLWIPTHVSTGAETAYRHNMLHELGTIIEGGVLAKLRMEWLRWTQYFFTANTAHFLLVLAGMVAAVGLWRRRVRQPGAVWAIALTVALPAAVISMFAFDSHTMVQHAIVLAALGYVACVVAIAAARSAGIWSSARTAEVFGVLLGMIVLVKLGNAYKLYGEYVRQHVSNAAEVAALRGAIPATGDVKIIGPTELWPLLSDRRQSVTLVDNDRAVFRDNHHDYRLDADRDYIGASYLVLNKEYYSTWFFNEAAAAWTRQGLIRQVAEVGDCNRAVQCLQIYAFVPGAHQIEVGRSE